MLNNRQQEQLQGIAALGRNEDTYLAHVAPDEMVVPAQALRDNPLLKVAIEKSISNYGIDPNQFLVGNGSMDLNPLTGLPEFGFLSKVWKKAKKALKIILDMELEQQITDLLPESIRSDWEYLRSMEGLMDENTLMILPYKIDIE